jgi:hypothetical protein
MINGRIDIGTAITFGKMAGSLLAVSCDDLSVRVIDCDTPGGRIVRELWGHANRITDFVRFRLNPSYLRSSPRRRRGSSRHPWTPL